MDTRVSIVASNQIDCYGERSEPKCACVCVCVERGLVRERVRCVCGG
jgi:hypothetical protein